MFSDGPRTLELTVSGHVHTPGEEIVVGAIITVAADSNPASSNYTWNNGISKEIIERGVSMVVTAEMLGNQSLIAEVCNIIPIPSPYTVCNDILVNVVVMGKC